MLKEKNQTNDTDYIDFYQLEEIYYQIIGSSWLVDSLYVFIVGPVGFIGLMLNLLSFIAFIRIKNKLNRTNLTKYFKVYTLASSIGCFVTMMYFLTTAHYFDFVNSFWVGVYSCKVSQYFITLYFFCNILDCMILFERLTSFVDILKNYSKFNPYNLCLITFLICNFINIPYFFYFTIRSEQELNTARLNPNLNESFTYCAREEYFQSFYGQLILILVILFRDILTLIFELTSSILSIFLFRNFLLKRKKAIKNQINTSQNQSVIIDSKESDSVIKTEKFNIKLTKMTIYLSICSTLLHLSVAISYLIMIIIKSNSNIKTNSFVLFCILVAYIKHISNFFFFFHFNKHFRNFFKFIIIKFANTMYFSNNLG